MLSIRCKFSSKNLSVIYRIKTSRLYSTEQKILSMLDKMDFEKSGENPQTSETRRRRFVAVDSNYQVKLEVLGNGALGASRCVHLYTDNCQYFFNCGEGVQRLAPEYKVKLSKVPRIFVTYPSWENVSGLIGSSLSMEASGISELYIHSHSAVDNLYSATAKFVVLRKLSVKMEKCEHHKEYFDGSTRIKYVRLYPSNVSNLNQNVSDSALATCTETNTSSESEDIIEEEINSADDIDYYECLGEKMQKTERHREENRRNEPEHSGKKDGKRKKRSHSEVCKRMKIAEEKYALSYICQTIKTTGALIVKKCVEYGVPPGPLLGKLKRGEDVILENGTLVKGCDVKNPDIPGAVIIVTECPSEDYLDGLLKEPAFYRHQSGINSLDDIASVVVHFTSAELVENAKYQEWINRFHPTTKHLYINNRNKTTGSIAVFDQQCKLNLLHSEIFPMLRGNGLPPYGPVNQINVEEGHSIVSDKPKDCKQSQKPGNQVTNEKVFFKCESNYHINVESLFEMYLRPIRPYDYSKVLVPAKEAILDEVFAIEGFLEELEKFRNEMVKLEPVFKSGQQYPKILFLGTGSSQPNKTRNTSGILIFVDEKKSIMLDCGEGTFTQLYNFFGKEKSAEVLRHLNVIYVSHMHADHHLGLITILKQRELAFKEFTASQSKKSNLEGSVKQEHETPYVPPYLLAPIQMTRWLDLFNKEFESISHLYDLIPNAYVMDKFFGKEKISACFKCLDLENIEMTLVDHCPSAFGVAITHKNGWKLTYSGDTRPCENLIKLGKDSDILIHEATMEDTLMAKAHLKAHSTTSQAIDCGQKMNAKFILLTHFSQRYSHIPLFNNKFTNKVGVALDNMMVSYNMLPALPKLINILKLLFSSFYERMEERKESYIVKKNRNSSKVKKIVSY